MKGTLISYLNDSSKSLAKSSEFRELSPQIARRRPHNRPEIVHCATLVTAHEAHLMSVCRYTGTT